MSKPRFTMLDRMEEIAEEQSAEQSSVADRSSDFFDSENNDDQSLKGSRSSQEGNEFYVLESHAEGDEEESESVSTTPNESIQMVASEDEDDVVGNANQKSNTLNEPIHEYDPVHIMGYEDLPLDDDDDDRKPAAPPQPRRLGSFLDAPRPDNNVDVKSSTLSKESERTSHSAPARTEGSAEVMATTTAASEDGTTTNGPPRRVTVHAHPDHGNPLPDHRRRFPTIYGSSRRSTEGFAVAHTGGEDDPSGRPHHPFWRTLRRRPHREPARAATSSVYHRSSSSSNVGMDAVERLRTSPHGSSTDFPHGAAVVAAATLPASVNSSSSNNNNRGVQFAQGDHVLVMLSLLDMADQFGDKESYTIDPVNAWGYPRGQGQTEVQKHGPYLFVLCAVTQVHFDEDERYYTVRRIDTGTEQRADMTYMEPIRDEEAIEAARQAAQRTERTMADQLLSALAPTRCGTRILRRCGEWQTIVVRRVVPWYAQMRNCAKTQIRRWMYGEHGCALHLRFSGINFLVLCSLFFLFLEVMLLAFFPNNWDRAFAIIGFIVWGVLVVELLLEIIIRPPNYREMMHSDKAYAPSTARHINRFHFICEALALALFLPQVICWSREQECPEIPYFLPPQAALWAITSVDRGKAARGRFALGFVFLRAFGLFRHWKQMWINHTFDGNNEESSLFRRLLFVEEKSRPLQIFFRRKKVDDDNGAASDDVDSEAMTQEESPGSEGDQQLKNAATIGTALMLVNSHRALFILLFIMCIFPMIYTVFHNRNTVSYNQVLLLQANNVISNTTEDCSYLQDAVQSWLKSVVVLPSSSRFIQKDNRRVFAPWAQLLPVRCNWQQQDGVITYCGSDLGLCNYYGESVTADSAANLEDFADSLGLRKGELAVISSQMIAPADFHDGSITADFFVQAIFDQSHIVTLAYFSLFLLLSSMVILGLVGLTVMRSDAERLVLYPLQRMLVIVVRYAENPLSIPTAQNTGRRKGSLQYQRDTRTDDSEEQLGHYETEQLINAISKIADLLRKCWGVAGAGIISSNLARTKDGRTVVFNPTIPGKQVYALFGFVGINDFSKQLRALEQDVMILINDVARVVHDEVYRWALGDSGQCNKNLGSAFLMVFRIGDFIEVQDKKKRATDVVFDSETKTAKVRQRQGAASRRRGGTKRSDQGSGGTLQLASLPGIQAFTDRALLGCLKSFAGLHRDQNLQNWQKDFRLGAGVGNFMINVIYGMDAGWAVEGAVGSEYKIDATYLSPHVNMASRMMSACKQYGVKVLLSQAVEELMSTTARSKLRHLDTVYVKGSNVAQRIYTYDARHEGVDFFLFERSPDQADIEADAYTQSIWDVDQDLKSMRQHVTDEFMKKFHQGVEQYLEGDWKKACRTLEEADDIMFEAVIEQGYLDYITDDLGEYGKSTEAPSEELARLKNEFGDGACKCLIQYMQRRDFVPPQDWHGVRHLMSK